MGEGIVATSRNVGVYSMVSGQLPRGRVWVRVRVSFRVWGNFPGAKLS